MINKPTGIRFFPTTMTLVINFGPHDHRYSQKVTEDNLWYWINSYIDYTGLSKDRVYKIG